METVKNKTIDLLPGVSSIDEVRKQRDRFAAEARENITLAFDIELELEKIYQDKQQAYRERNKLVCALSKIFPAHLCHHETDDETWDPEWMWIVRIDLPTGQASWHLKRGELKDFKHLEIKDNDWDGHDTEEKYRRLDALEVRREE